MSIYPNRLEKLHARFFHLFVYGFIIIPFLFSCDLKESSIQTIRIRDCDPLDPQSFISHISYTPLQSMDSIRVKEINKLIAFEDRYYILDNQVEGEVYCFLKNGDFLFRLNAQGRGRGRYRYMENISIDPNRRLLEVYDRGGLKLIRYDLNGNFVEEISCPYYFEDFLSIDSSSYALYGLGISNFFSLNDSSFNSVMYIDRDFKMEYQQGLPFIDPLHKVFFEGRITLSNQAALATYGFQDTVYSLNIDTLLPQFVVDFGEQQLPQALKEEVLTDEQPMDRLVELLDTPYAKGIHHLLQSDQYLSFEFRTTDKNHYQGLYDLSTRTCHCLPAFFVKEGVMYHNPVALDHNTFIGVLFAQEFMDSIQTIPSTFLSPQLAGIKAWMTPESNPVIVRMEYR